MPDRVLITGAGGFIGIRTAEYYCEQGHEVLCLVKEDTRKDRLLRLKHLGCKLIFGALPDKIPWEDIPDIGTALHLAGALTGKHAQDKDYMRINAEGTRVLVHGLKGKCAKFVFISTAGVYGVCINASERDMIGPLNSYERSKASAEEAVVRSGMGYIIVRPGLVFGPGDTRFSSLLRMARFGILPSIDNGKCLLQPIFVDDLVKIIYLLDKTDATGEIFNSAGDRVICYKDLLKMANPSLVFLDFPLKMAASIGKAADSLGRIAGIRLPVTSERVRLFSESRTYDISKVVERTGYRFTPLEESIRSTLQP